MKKVVGITLLALFFSIGTANAAVFNNDLSFGLENDSDVRKLQEFLTAEGVYSGPITGNFYSLTLNGVKTFQIKYGITPSAGFFGPLTRTKANAVISSQVSESESQAVAETGTTPPTPSPTTDPMQLQLSALLAQLELLQKQLDTLQQTSQGIQNIQNQVTQQTQILQNIQTNTIPTQQQAAQPQTTTQPTPPKSIIYVCILYRIANGDDPSIHKYASIVLNKEFTTTAERDKWIIGDSVTGNPGWKPLIEAANDPNYDGKGTIYNGVNVHGSVDGWWGKGYDCYEK